MKAVDTNVLLRYLVGDDELQSPIAAVFMRQRTEDDPAFVSLIVLAELIWALQTHYGYPREQVHSLLMALIETAEVVFEDEEYLSLLITGDRPIKADIADHLISHCASRAGCSATVTFDRQAAKSVSGMELLT